MFTLSGVFEGLVVIFYLLICGAIFYAVMERIGNALNFAGMFLKLYDKIRSIYLVTSSHHSEDKTKK